MIRPEYSREEIQAIIDSIEIGTRLNLPEVEGYSGWKVRNLLNRIIGLRKDTTYLEIGVHLGSTYIPAMFGNSTAKGTAVDAWSMFGDLEQLFVANLEAHNLSSNTKVIHADFMSMDISEIQQPVDVYFYDGPHETVEYQYKAFSYLAPVLADQFVALVDDFNWSEPRDGTYQSLRELGYTIEAEWVLKGPYNGSADSWWNSLFVGIIRK